MRNILSSILSVLLRIEDDTSIDMLDDYLDSTLKNLYDTLNSRLIEMPPYLKHYRRIRYCLNRARLVQEKTRISRDRWYLNEQKKLTEFFIKRRARLNLNSDRLDEMRYEEERIKARIEKKRADQEEIRADCEQVRAEGESYFANRVKGFADRLEMRADEAREFVNNLKKRVDYEKERADQEEKKINKLERMLSRKLTNLVKECRYFLKKYFF